MSAVAEEFGWSRRARSGLPRLSRLAPSVTEAIQVQSPIVSPPSTLTEPRWLDAVEHRIAELSGLNHNWDGRGSAAVSTDALAFMRSMLGSALSPTMSAPAIVPLGHGGVQLEWIGRMSDIEVEVVKPYDIRIYRLNRETGEDNETHAVADFSALAGILRAELD